MGHFGAAVHVGVRFKAQVHPHGDGPGLLGAAISKAVLIDPSEMRSLPNKAVDVMACKLSGDRLMLASSTHGSLDPAPAGHVCFRLRSVQGQLRLTPYVQVPNRLTHGLHRRGADCWIESSKQ